MTADGHHRNPPLLHPTTATKTPPATCTAPPSAKKKQLVTPTEEATSGLRKKQRRPSPAALHPIRREERSDDNNNGGTKTLPLEKRWLAGAAVESTTGKLHRGEAVAADGVLPFISAASSTVPTFYRRRLPSHRSASSPPSSASVSLLRICDDELPVHTAARQGS
nr:hypothetical protein Iba_chr13dCG7570 [Ipomoea batatas]